MFVNLNWAGGAPASFVREQIQKTKELTKKPFGVNVMLMNPEADGIARVIVEEGVPVVSQNLLLIIIMYDGLFGNYKPCAHLHCLRAQHHSRREASAQIAGMIKEEMTCAEMIQEIMKQAESLLK